jgi:Tfp pilus assembly protein PilX
MHLMRLLHRCQQGFTTVTLMGTLVVGGLMVAATFAAVQPDIAFTQKDEDSKQAYAAAESGLNYYLNRLGQDSSYYVKCDQVDQPTLNAVNLEWAGTGADPRRWQTIPGSSAQYSIELLAVQNTSLAGTELCNPALPGAGMVDPTTGTFRIRATGRVRAPGTGSECSTTIPYDQRPAQCRPFKRSIIATLRPKSFIDFLWFTDYETLPPFAYGSGTYDPTWAASNCAKYRPFRNSNCSDPDFITPDNLQGPVKTNDSISICGDPTFGRDTDDLIELNQEDPGYEECSGSDPNFLGEVKWPAGVLPLPQSNAALETAADVGYVFTGETKIVLNASNISITTGVTSTDINGTTVTKSYPQSGVIYVKNSTCAPAYDRDQDYTYNPSANPLDLTEYMDQPGCGNVWVSGTYSKDLTIGADNDIVIMNDLLRDASTPKALLGLVANNFVRIFHPIIETWSGCTNDPDGPGEITIQAAMLALKQSFITDNWHSCPPLGTIHVNGAIAQKYRGTVGTHSGGSVNTGYAKDYQYNDELRYRQPPHFINPAELEWRVVRENEQVPAR